MYAYIDESGHTGINLFDPAQPYFFNVAMSSLHDFDSIYRKDVKDIAQKAGVCYLHASEMGGGGVEAIAESVGGLIESSEVRFYFGLVDKRDTAVMKFYDAVFDPGENAAMANLHYAARLLRLGLLLEFASITEPADVELFWKAMTSSRSPQTEEAAVTAIDNVLQRVGALSDPRAKELIDDVLSWAKDNIDVFSFWSGTKAQRYGHVPNIFTLPELFGGIYESAKLWESDVDVIVHDRQSQFEQTLKEWHQLSKSFDSAPMYYFGDMAHKFPDISGSQLVMKESASSAGLQVVDIVLWAFSRSVSSKHLGPRASDLIGKCFNPRDLFHLSLDWVEYQVAVELTALTNRPLSRKQMREAKKLMNRVERKRLRRMRRGFSNRPLAQRGKAN